VNFLQSITLDRGIEILVVILSLAYVGLIAVNRRSGWWFGIAASLLSVWLFIRVNLFAESVLYVYYVVMGCYGAYFWKYGTQSNQLPLITVRTFRFHVSVIGLSIVLIFVLAEALKQIGSSNVYGDAATTVLSFIATWMVAKRILENWIYWVVIDLFSVWLYHDRGLPVYALLMLAYSIIAGIGFILWWRQFREQEPPPSAAA